MKILIPEIICSVMSLFSLYMAWRYLRQLDRQIAADKRWLDDIVKANDALEASIQTAVRDWPEVTCKPQDDENQDHNAQGRPTSEPQVLSIPPSTEDRRHNHDQGDDND